MVFFFFRVFKNRIFLTFCALPQGTAPRPGGSFGGLAAGFSKSCDCLSSASFAFLRHSGRKPSSFFLRLVFIAIFVFRFFVRLPYLGYLLLLKTLFVSVRKVFIATFVFVCITRLPLFFHFSAFFQKKTIFINIFKDFLMLFGALAADFPKSCDCLLTHA